MFLIILFLVASRYKYGFSIYYLYFRTSIDALFSVGFQMNHQMNQIMGKCIIDNYNIKKMKQFRFTLFILLIVGLVSCNNDNKEEDEKNKSVVINEILPINSQNGSDEDGEFDDWIELYNLSNENIDISGYYLTDSKKEYTKWKFPVGTTIVKNGFLIVWADGDSTHVSGLHTNYKLSSDGENVVLLSPDLEVLDLVEYPATVLEQSYARVPNGTGKFKWLVPTFNKSND